MPSSQSCNNDNDYYTSKEGVSTHISHVVRDSIEKEGVSIPTSYHDNDSNNKEGVSTHTSLVVNESITKGGVSNPTSHDINQDSHTVRSLHNSMWD